MTYVPATYTDFKNSARVASTATLTVASPGATIDGITMVAGDRVLLKDQSTGSQNGIYTWNSAATPLTRTLDADQNGELTTGSQTYIEEGTTNLKKTYTLTTTGTIIIGTTSMTYEQLTAVSPTDLAPAERRAWFGV